MYDKILHFVKIEGNPCFSVYGIADKFGCTPFEVGINLGIMIERGNVTRSRDDYGNENWCITDKLQRVNVS